MTNYELHCLLCRAQGKPSKVVGDPMLHLTTNHAATEIFTLVPVFAWSDLKTPMQPIVVKPLKKKPIAPVEEVVEEEPEEEGY
jgi:hypothetical protein